MLDYDGADMESSDPAPAPRTASLLGRISAPAILNAAMRRKSTVALLALLGAATGFGVTKALTPRYVATAQIYLDPHGLPGLEGEDSGRQDSTGYINFVETQARLLTSQLVLDRVVRKEKLDADPEFGAAAGGGALGGLLGQKNPQSNAEDALSAARALGRQIVIRRPERTFIIEISATSRSPAKAARIANAVAQAYIDVRSSMQSEAAQQATVSYTARLEKLHDKLMDAERKVETYKIENGLLGTREQYVDEQSLKDLNQQLSYARTRLDDARAKYDQVRRARNSEAALGALVATLNIANLSNLRAQQTAALERLAELSAELGPRHPTVRNATARAEEMRRLVDSELSRLSASIQKDYEQAQDVVEGLRRDVDRLRDRAADTAQASVKLRDLEREVEVSRTVYQSFLTRSRQSAEAQSLDPTSTHVVTKATPPSARSFPPGAGIMTLTGLLGGLLLGVATAFLQENLGLAVLQRATRRQDPSMEAPGKTDMEPGGETGFGAPARLIIDAATRFEMRDVTRLGETLDFTRLGLPVMAHSGDGGEIDAFAKRFMEAGRDKRRQTICVAGATRNEARTIVAVNFAIALCKAGLKPALFDSDEKEGVLTSFVDRTFELLDDPAGSIEDTVQGGAVVMPSRASDASYRASARVLLHELLEPGSEFDLVLGDGAFADEDLISRVDWVILVADRHSDDIAEMQRLPARLTEKIALSIRFEHTDPWNEKDAELRAIA